MDARHPAEIFTGTAGRRAVVLGGTGGDGRGRSCPRRVPVGCWGDWKYARVRAVGVRRTASYRPVELPQRRQLAARSDETVRIVGNMSPTIQPAAIDRSRPAPTDKRHMYWVSVHTQPHLRSRCPMPAAALRPNPGGWSDRRRTDCQSPAEAHAGDCPVRSRRRTTATTRLH
jgi:hypothetical protein